MQEEIPFFPDATRCVWGADQEIRPVEMSIE